VLLGAPSSTHHQPRVPVPHVPAALSPPSSTHLASPHGSRAPDPHGKVGGDTLVPRGQSRDGAASRGRGGNPAPGATSTLYWVEWEVTGVARGPPAGQRGQCQPGLAPTPSQKGEGDTAWWGVYCCPPSPGQGAEPGGLVAPGGGTGRGCPPPCTHHRPKELRAGRWQQVALSGHGPVALSPRLGPRGDNSWSKPRVRGGR